MKTTLPADSAERKDIPLLSGCLRYAPAALAGMARWSKVGNDKHNPGEPLHHARGKSMDHGDCIVRHLLDIQDILANFERRPQVLSPAEVAQLMNEADALVWRAALLSQDLHERFAGAPLAPAARLPDVKPVVWPGAFESAGGDIGHMGQCVVSSGDRGAAIAGYSVAAIAGYSGAVLGTGGTGGPNVTGICGWCLADPRDPHALGCPNASAAEPGDKSSDASA